MSSLTSWLMFGEHYACKASSCVPQFIGDPALRFWFHVFSPHRTRWPAYDQAERGKLIHDHASTVFEDYCRARHPGAAAIGNPVWNLVAFAWTRGPPW